MGRSFALVRVAVVGVLSVTAVFVSAPRCLACSCAFRTPAQIVGDADAVFVGRVVAERPVDPVTTIQTFAVSRVYRGDLTSSVDLVSGIGVGGGSSCAVLFSQGEQVAVAVHRNDDGSWSSDACSLLSEAEVQKVAGAGYRPRPGSSPTTSASPAAPTPRPASRGPIPGWLVPLLGATGGVALIAASLLVSRRRARRGAPSSDDGGGPIDVGPADPPEPLG